MRDGRFTEADFGIITAGDMAMLDLASRMALDDVDYSTLMLDEDGL